jgi:hypothetical protein
MVRKYSISDGRLHRGLHHHRANRHPRLRANRRHRSYEGPSSEEPRNAALNNYGVQRNCAARNYKSVVRNSHDCRCTTAGYRNGLHCRRTTADSPNSAGRWCCRNSRFPRRADDSRCARQRSRNSSDDWNWRCQILAALDPSRCDCLVRSRSEWSSSRHWNAHQVALRKEDGCSTTPTCGSRLARSH